MGNQEAFTKVLTELRRQDAQSREMGMCRYRSPNGRCAVGWLIPDEEYLPEMESCDYQSLHSQVPSLHGVDVGLLKELQRAHDSPWSWGLKGVTEVFEENMKRVAKVFGLSYEEPVDAGLG